jgi:hemolysin III
MTAISSDVSSGAPGDKKSSETKPFDLKLFKIPTPLPFQTPGEEIANSILHGLGILLAVMGLVFLVSRSKGYFGGTLTGTKAITAYVIFSASLILMFLASTLYHAIQPEGAKRVLRVLDHSAVYILIAGTYTPFSLLGLGGTLGWIYFWAEWALAVTGVVLYSISWKTIKRIEVAVYVLMGWAIVAGFHRLWASIPRVSFILILAGGLFYTLGTFWYRRKHRRLSHVIWHVFVIAAAACHWLSLWFMS